MVFTYDIFWKQEENFDWFRRWHQYFNSKAGAKVHWFGILTSMVVVLVMAVLVAMIVLRTVRKDLAKYEELIGENQEEMKEEYGWKMVSGDVFRGPNNAMGLAV